MSNNIVETQTVNSYTDQNNNPTLKSPYTPFELPFYHTLESMADVSEYSAFINNAVHRFRASRTYKNYKGFLLSLGLNRSQVHGNITSEMADIEMHHHMLTIFDIAFVITEHMLRTKGQLTTFDLVLLLKREHRLHHICLVMLDKTSHQVQQSNKDFFIHPKMCFGNWIEFLNDYPYGITKDIAAKIISYLEKADKIKDTDDASYLNLRQQILDWSQTYGG